MYSRVNSELNRVLTFAGLNLFRDTISRISNEFFSEIITNYEKAHRISIMIRTLLSILIGTDVLQIGTPIVRILH